MGQHHKDKDARKKEDTHCLKERAQLLSGCLEVLTCQAEVLTQTRERQKAEQSRGAKGRDQDWLLEKER